MWWTLNLLKQSARFRLREYGVDLGVLFRENMVVERCPKIVFREHGPKTRKTMWHPPRVSLHRINPEQSPLDNDLVLLSSAVQYK